MDAVAGWDLFGLISTTVTIGLGLISLVLFLLWSPRKSNEKPGSRRSLPSIRVWRPRHYSLGMEYLGDYCKQLADRQYATRFKRGFVSQSDLVRWVLQMALTCAAFIVPQALGKATLFRVSTIRQYGKHDIYQPYRREIRIYASEFVGIFPTNQVTEPTDGTRIRSFLLGGPNQSDSQVPAALKCVRKGEPILEPIAGGTSFDRPELEQGTTHVLAIPLCGHVKDVAFLDQPVSITVDLRYSRFGKWWASKRDFKKRSIYSRANRLMMSLQMLPELKEPQFFPKPDLASHGSRRPARQLWERLTSSTGLRVGGVIGWGRSYAHSARMGNPNSNGYASGTGALSIERDGNTANQYSVAAPGEGTVKASFPPDEPLDSSS